MKRSVGTALLLCVLIGVCTACGSIQQGIKPATAVPDVTPEAIQAQEVPSVGTVEPKEENDEYTLSYPVSVDKNKELTLKLHGKKLPGDNQTYGIREMEVFDGGTLLQRIMIEDAIFAQWQQNDFGGYTESYSENGELIRTDMNFDGSEDIGLIGWITASANIPYYYWLWDVERQRFEYAFCLPNAEVDAQARQIISGTRNGADSYYTNYYEYDADAKLQNVKRVMETMDESGATTVETYELVDGTLQKVD